MSHTENGGGARHRDPYRTPNWLKAFYAVCILIAFMAVVGPLIGGQC